AGWQPIDGKTFSSTATSEAVARDVALSLERQARAGRVLLNGSSHGAQAPRLHTVELLETCELLNPKPCPMQFCPRPPRPLARWNASLRWRKTPTRRSPRLR